MTPGILSENPPLTALERISPSRFQSLKGCASREIWAAGGLRHLLPAPPAAKLGSAIHRLLEEAGKGLFREGGTTAIEKRWDELTAEAESAMRSSWLESHFVPLKATVRDYQVRRLRAIQRAAEISQSLRPAPTLPAGQLPRKCELWVATPDGLAGGYIDQVEVCPAGAVLRDYKTGHILEGASAATAGVVKESYEVQLKLYAAIYASATGVWPTKLELIPLQGPVREVEFSRSECEELLGEARNAVADINSIIANNAPARAETLLAAPSPGSCRYCLFRPACSAYRTARERGATDDAWPEDLWGTVREKRVLGNGKILLGIQQAIPGAPAVTIRGLNATPERHPALSTLVPGDSVAAFGLKSSGIGGTLQESSWTVIYRLKERGT
jgi:RecB family exonuclease